MNAEITFKDLLKARITNRIKELRAEGTVGASVPCLLQLVRPPSRHFAGAPYGPTEYRQLFGELVAATPAFKSFTTI